MTYHLAIDLGTTYTAAAIARDGRVEAVPLGHRAVSIPSVLYIKGDEFIVGEAAIRHVGIHVTSFIAEPVAAATFYASQRPLPAASVVAVYDLGGGTFDAAVVRKTDVGFAIIGRPEGIDRLGGVDFDHAVFSHVLASIGETADHLDGEEPGMVAAVTQLREECVEAKEALSAETDVDIAVLLPGKQTEVRLTRPEFENMIRPAINETIVALRRALVSAGVVPGQVSVVLLVGGSSRIPLVSQMVTADLGRPVAVDARPKDAIALGAALAGWRLATNQTIPVTVAAPTERFVPPPTAARSGRGRLIGLAAAAVVALVAGIFGVRALTADPTNDPTDTTEIAGGQTTVADGDETTVTDGGEEQTFTTLPGDDWGPAAEAAFLDACTDPSGSFSGPPVDQCQCLYDFISANQSLDEFNQDDIEFQQGGDPPPVASEAITECVIGG